MREAPLFIGAYDLHGWLLDRLGETPRHPEVCRGVLEHSRGLLEALVLALSGFERGERLIRADEHAACLRAHLRLAADKGLLAESQHLHASRAVAELGRQIGGWRRALDGLQ